MTKPLATHQHTSKKYLDKNRASNSSLKSICGSILTSKKAKIRNSFNQVSHLTQDTTWESDKNTRKNHKQESQEVTLATCWVRANLLALLFVMFSCVLSLSIVMPCVRCDF